MKPRGNAKKLIDAMEGQRDKVRWTPAECAKAMGIPQKSVNVTLRASLRREWLFKHEEGRQVFYSLQAPAAEPQEFDAHRWLDGDIDMWGLHELPDGGRRLTLEMARRLKPLIVSLPD